jgi:hypothetical protein
VAVSRGDVSDLSVVSAESLRLQFKAVINTANISAKVNNVPGINPLIIPNLLVMI